MQEEPTKIWNRDFVYLLLIDLAVMLGNYMMRPIISTYAVELGASLAVAGIVAGLAFAVATLMRPITGFLSDRLGKKTMFLIATVAFTAASFGCALANSVVLVGICCAIQGVALSFQAIGLTALVTLSVPRSRIGSAMGWMGIIITITMAVGPGIAASLAEWGGYRASFTFGGTLCAVSFIMLAFFKAPEGARGHQVINENADKSRVAHILKQSFHGPTVPIAMTALMSMWAGSSLSSLLFTIEATGYLTHAVWYFTVYAVVALCVRPLAGWASDRTQSATVAAPLLLLGAAGMVVLVFGHGAAAVIIAGVCMGAGQASALSVVQAESVRGVDAAHLGRATNTYYLGVDLGAALGTWVGGILMQVGTPALMFGFNAFTCITAASAVIALHFAKKRRR